MAGREEILTDELKDYLKRLRESNSKLTAKRAQKKVLEYLIGSLKQSQPMDSREVLIAQIECDKKLPGISRIGKYLTELKKLDNPSDVLDTAWSIGAAIEYEVTSDVVPLLIEYRQILLDTTQEGGDISRRLTIRKARWMSRLYPIVKKILDSLFPNEHKKQIGYLSRIADEYAERERAANNSNRKFSNTYILDALVFVRDNLGLSIDDALILARVGEMTSDEFDTFRKAMNNLQKDGEI